MTQNALIIAKRVTFSERLSLQPDPSKNENSWIIQDKETGKSVGSLSQKDNENLPEVELFWGKGGFMAVVVSAGKTIYFGLPGSQINVDGLCLTLEKDALSTAYSGDVASAFKAPPVLDSAQAQTIQAMILGAGLATRFERISGHSTDYSKPAVPLLGRHSVIGCLARHLAQHGFSRLLVNTYFKPESLKASLADCSAAGPAPEEIFYIDEDKPSGTAGAVRKLLTDSAYKGWLDQDKPLIVVQGDSLTDADFSALINAHTQQGALITIGCQVVADEDVDKFGIIVTDKSDADGQSGRIVGFQEKPALKDAKSRLGSTGFYVFSPKAFPLVQAIYAAKLNQAQTEAKAQGNPAPEDVELDFAQDVFSGVLAQIQQDPSLGTFWAQQMSCYWSDIGNPRQYINSVRDIYAGKVGLTMPENPSQYYRNGVIYWEGAQVAADQENAQLEGNVVVAQRFKPL